MKMKQSQRIQLGTHTLSAGVTVGPAGLIGGPNLVFQTASGELKLFVPKSSFPPGFIAEAGDNLVLAINFFKVAVEVDETPLELN